MDFTYLLAESMQNQRLLQKMQVPLLVGFIALVVTWLSTPLVQKWAIKCGAVDDPKGDARRIHREPIPRWGGIAIYAGIVISLVCVLPFTGFERPFPMYLVGVLVLGGAVVVMGAYDDLYQYSPKVQALFLLFVGIAIQFFVDGGGRVQISGTSSPFNAVWQNLDWAAIPLTAMFIFVVTKTMDTIDGVDGLAAGIAAIAAVTVGLIYAKWSQPPVPHVALAVAGASIGFLRHNYNPARIFMGTGGAQLLGFMLACLSIVSTTKSVAAVALAIPLFVFGVPLADAVQVIIRRKLSGQPITQADKRHLHHQLLNRGLSQRQTVWVMYVFAIALCGVLLLAVKLRG